MDKQIKLGQEKIVKKLTVQRIKTNNIIYDTIMNKLLNELQLIDKDDFIIENEKKKNKSLLSILPEIEELGLSDINSTIKTLKEVGYFVNEKTYKNIKSEVKELDPIIIKNFIERQIEGQTFSDRIWKHKEDLLNDLNKELENYIINKDITIKQLSKKISERYNVDEYKTFRLVKHESATLESSIKYKIYIDSEIIDELIFLTMNDEFVTKEICLPLHGKIFNKNDSNLPIPPLHIGCRSILRPNF